MGTSVDVFLPRTIESAEEITARLNCVFNRCAGELSIIEREGLVGGKRPWNLKFVPQYEGMREYYFDEGPYGFDIRVYRKVLCFGSNERFYQLYDPESLVAYALQSVIEAVVRVLAVPPMFATVAGGMGDSDAAEDCMYDGGSFSEVCEVLRKEHGEPAHSWDELAPGETAWAFIALSAEGPTLPAG